MQKIHRTTVFVTVCFSNTAASTKQTVTEYYMNTIRILNKNKIHKNTQATKIKIQKRKIHKILNMFFCMFFVVLCGMFILQKY